MVNLVLVLQGLIDLDVLLGPVAILIDVSFQLRPKSRIRFMVLLVVHVLINK